MTLDEFVRQIVREEILITSRQAGAPAQPAAVPVTAAPSGPPPVAVPQIPAAGPPVAAPPGMAPPPQFQPPPGPPQVSPPGPPVAGLPQATAPRSPASPPVTAVPTLDEIRALANDFARAKPQEMHQFQAFMASKGVQSLADMPAAEYPACKLELQRLIGGA